MAARIKDVFDIDAEIIEGTNGIFDVKADGALVFSKHESKRFPEHDEVIAALRTLG